MRSITTNSSKVFFIRIEVTPQFFKAGSEYISALRKTAGSGSTKNEYGSTVLDTGQVGTGTHKQLLSYEKLKSPKMTHHNVSTLVFVALMCHRVKNESTF